MSFKFQQINMDKFLKYREEVLKEWNLDSSIDLEIAMRFHNSLPNHKNFVKKINTEKKKKKTLLHSCIGNLNINAQIENINLLVKKTNVDFLSIIIDSFTRDNKYDNCEKAIQESYKSGRLLINGFPMVNYGVLKCRDIISEVDIPLQIKHGSPNACLLSEVALASGISSIEGGGISHNIPFSKSISLEESINKWKYVDRLVGIYEENGIEINRESYSQLTTSLVPPAISNVIQILESLLAAEQGVKNITLSCSQYGNMIQDIATFEALVEQTREYLDKFNFKNINLSTVFQQWIGGFPKNEVNIYGIISYATMVAKFAKADRIFIRNPNEFNGTYSKDILENSIQVTNSLLKIIEKQNFNSYPKVEFEKNIIKKEVRLIMDKVIELGNQDLTQGIIKAFSEGIIDVAFAPSKYNLGKVMPARDSEGMIRYLDVGNLPFNEELRNFHRAKLEERAKLEKRDVSFQMTVDDIFSISNGELIGNQKK